MSKIKAFFSASFSIVVIIVISIIGFSCNFGSSNNDENQASAKTQIAKVFNEKYNYNLFVDNSGSMKDFTPINGKNATEYQRCLSNFIQYLFQPQTNTYKIYTFNTGIDTLNRNFKKRESIDSFINDLAAGKLKKGNPNNTELERILTKIIEGLDRNDITVIISDFIFDGKNVADKTTLRDQISHHLDDKLNAFDLSTLVLKFHSKWRNDPQKPYYMMLFGNENKINDILLYVLHHNYSSLGFDDFYELSNPNKDIAAQLKLLPEYYGIHAPATSLITENAKCSDNIFRCAIRINMSSVPYSDAYLADINNYTFPDSYKLKITTEQTPFTHIIELESQKLNKGKIELGLRNKKLDSSILANKTDMPQLLESITEIYKQHYNSTNYFTKTITIN